LAKQGIFCCGTTFDLGCALHTHITQYYGHRIHRANTIHFIYLFEGAFPQTQTNHVMMSTKELTGCTLSDSDKNIM
jgi:hypothetical protein